MIRRSILVRASFAAILGVASAAAVFAVREHLGERRAAPASSADAPCDEASATACARPGSAPGDRAHAPVLEGDQPRLVEFLSGHCPACERMAPVVKDIERKCLLGEERSLVRVNVDEPEGEALAGRYGVNALPTFVGVDAKGIEVLRRVGVQSPLELASVLGEVRGRACPPVL
jgi:cytochrome c-type biogenesis protein